MAKFNYYQDQLVKVWERRHFTIEAETQEEADETARQIVRENYQVYAEEKENVEFIDQETLIETEENVEPADNNGKITMEVWRGNSLIEKN